MTIMAFPGNCMRIVLQGSLPGNEVWSAGFYAQRSTTGAQDRANAVVSGPAWTAALTAIRGLITGGAAVTQVTVYDYPTSNPAAADVGTALVSGAAGTAASAPHPNQVAMCLTLRSANATRRGRGRFYLPANGVVLGTTTGLMTSPTVQSVVDAVGPFLKFQQALVVSSAAGQTYPVTRVDADSVLDQQTSRRDRLPRTRSGFNF